MDGEFLRAMKNIDKTLKRIAMPWKSKQPQAWTARSCLRGLRVRWTKKLLGVFRLEINQASPFDDGTSSSSGTRWDFQYCRGQKLCKHIFVFGLLDACHRFTDVSCFGVHDFIHERYIF